MFVFIIFFQLNRSKIDQSVALFIFPIIIIFTSDRSTFLNLKKSTQIIVYKSSEIEFDIENRFEKLNSSVSDMTFFFNII